jgi:hypothetical protein
VVVEIVSLAAVVTFAADDPHSVLPRQRHPSGGEK